MATARRPPQPLDLLPLAQRPPSQCPPDAHWHPFSSSPAACLPPDMQLHGQQFGDFAYASQQHQQQQPSPHDQLRLNTSAHHQQQPHNHSQHLQQQPPPQPHAHLDPRSVDYNHQQAMHNAMANDFSSWPMTRPHRDGAFVRPQSSHAPVNSMPQARLVMPPQPHQQQQQQRPYMAMPDDNQPLLSSGLEEQPFVFDVHDAAPMNHFAGIDSAAFLNNQLLSEFGNMPMTSMPQNMSRPYGSSIAFPQPPNQDTLFQQYIMSQPHDQQNQPQQHQQHTPPRSMMPINMEGLHNLADFEELSPSSTLSSAGIENFVTTPDSTMSFTGLFEPASLPNSLQGMAPLSLHSRNESYHSHRSDMTTASASPRDIWQQPTHSPDCADSDACDDVALSHSSHFAGSNFGSVSSDTDDLISLHGASSEGTPWPISPEAPRAMPIAQRRRGSLAPPAASSKTTPKTIAKKPMGKKDAKDVKKLAETLDRRVGRRKGPLTSDQRRQAGEIRKLKACLRCKFLKKTCDPNSPCAGCKPSHARLWMVPCTRLDIRDLHYFLDGWTVDYERHVSEAISIKNIIDYAPREQTIFISHGFNQAISVQAREVFVRDDDVFKLDWIETLSGKPRKYIHETSHLAIGRGGLDEKVLHDYMDRHIDASFEQFITEFFEGTKVWTELLFAIYELYRATELPMLRNALKFFITYNLTQHVTYEENASDSTGMIGNVSSIHKGRVVAPIMINFEIKLTLALMWRKMHKQLLQDLSVLFSSVYNGQKQKNWAMILMLSSVLLMAWEEMQFDSFYRMPERECALKFAHEMESVPVGVITGLFAAISQKMPSLREWDSAEHRNLFASHEHADALCKGMEQVKAAMFKHEDYLKSRSHTEFDREDFDCLCNKFVHKLLLRP